MQTPSLLERQLVSSLHLAHSLFEIGTVGRILGSEAMVQISGKKQPFLLRLLIHYALQFSQAHAPK
jgi:hypothetical protein